MKKLITFLTFVCLSNVLFAQFEYTIDFDDQAIIDEHIFIDTMSNPNNIWQIGNPGKEHMFEYNPFGYNAMVTDLYEPYPTNDTSVFYLRHIRYGGEWGSGVANESLLLDFWYMMDADSADYGQIEVSIDHRATWINLMTQDEEYQFEWMEPKPVLSGEETNGHFSLEMRELAYLVGYSDTLWYRFSFITDGKQDNRDGWLIDKILIHDYWEGIDEYDNKAISVYPNPTAGIVHIAANTEGAAYRTVRIIDMMGQTVWEQETNAKTLNLDLPNGQYIMKLSGADKVYTKKIVIEK